MSPIVIVEEGNVPLHRGVKIGVVSCFGTAQSAIGDGKVKLRVLSHAAEHRGHVLDGMTADGQDAVAGLSQVGLLRSETVLEEREWRRKYNTLGELMAAKGGVESMSGRSGLSSL
jgi:hypothetical protein